MPISEIEILYMIENCLETIKNNSQASQGQILNIQI